MLMPNCLWFFIKRKDCSLYNIKTTSVTYTIDCIIRIINKLWKIKSQLLVSIMLHLSRIIHFMIFFFYFTCENETVKQVNLLTFWYFFDWIFHVRAVFMSAYDLFITTNQFLVVKLLYNYQYPFDRQSVCPSVRCI